MATQSIQHEITRIERAKSQINKSALRTGKDEPVFRELCAAPVNYTCFEAGFLRMVSWLYMLYYEAGRGNLDFLMDKFDIYELDTKMENREHYKVSRILRTTLQHNMDMENAKNTNYKKFSDQWFLQNIKKSFPLTRDDWHTCLQAIIREALSLLNDLSQAIKYISRDEFKTFIIDDWNRKSAKFYQPHEFDQVIQKVAQEFGIAYFDYLKFRKQNADSWLQELQNRTGEYDINIEARKLIERDIIKKPVLPITGTDIMEAFDLPPGQRIREITQVALRIYGEKPCSKEDLLDQLHSIIINT